jgi:hypothetical protein
VYDFRDRLGSVYEKFITPEVSLNFIILWEIFKCFLKILVWIIINLLELIIGMVLSYFLFYRSMVKMCMNKKSEKSEI